MKKFFVDLKAKRIHVPSSRWYEIGDYQKTGLAYPSVTSVLQAKAKHGLVNWQIQLAKLGIDPKDEGQRNMEEGSNVHDAIERLLAGEEIVYSEDYDFWGEWMPIVRFTEAHKLHQIKPILIEQTIWSNELQVAGTLDLMCTLIPKGLKKPVLAIIDHKRSSGASVEYQWQILAYKKMLTEMIEVQDKYSKRLVSWLTDNLKINEEKLLELVKGSKTYLLLLNTPTKSGWRLTEVEDNKEKLNGFIACNNMFRAEYPNLKYVQELYPTNLKLS